MCPALLAGEGTGWDVYGRRFYIRDSERTKTSSQAEEHPFLATNFQGNSLLVCTQSALHMDISPCNDHSRPVSAPGKTLNQTWWKVFYQKSHVGHFRDFFGCLSAEGFRALAVPAHTEQRFLISYIIYSCSDSTESQHVPNIQKGRNPFFP